MARTVTVKIDGKAYHMPASYAASREIAETVADPLMMAVNDVEYGPASWGTENIIDIIYIGLRYAGCDLDRDDVGEEVVKGGVVVYMKIAAQYVAALVAGGPEKPAPRQKKAPAKSKRGSTSSQMPTA